MDDEITDEEIRDALRAIHAGDATLAQVLGLAVASDEFDPPLVPRAVIDAVGANTRWMATSPTAGSISSHGIKVRRRRARMARPFARSVPSRTRTSSTGSRRRSTHNESKHTREEIRKEAVKHFLAYRRSVGGPEFGIPEHGEELAEVLVEYVIAHASAIPAADAKLVRKKP